MKNGRSDTSWHSVPSAWKYMHIVLAMEARKDPNTSRQSRESHGETPVRSCRECHRKNEGHQFLDRLYDDSQREPAPNDVVGKVPVRSCREFHQKTAEHQFFWTGIEAECRDAVCVGFLRNCSHAASGQFQSTVLSLALESVN